MKITRRSLSPLVCAYIRKNPTASSSEIAASLDTSPEYVRATLRRKGLKLKRKKGQRYLPESLEGRA